MKKLLAVLAAGFLAVTSAQLFAAETKKEGAPAAANAPAKLEKPASVSQEAWNKMTDAEKKKAVEAAAKGDKSAAKKEKKGGC